MARGGQGAQGPGPGDSASGRVGVHILEAFIKAQKNDGAAPIPTLFLSFSVSLFPILFLSITSLFFTLFIFIFHRLSSFICLLFLFYLFIIILFSMTKPIYASLTISTPSLYPYLPILLFYTSAFPLLLALSLTLLKDFFGQEVCAALPPN